MAHPDIQVKPPFIALAFLAVGVVAHYFIWSQPIVASPWNWLGLIPVLVMFPVAVMAERTMSRAGTGIDPTKADVTALITTGPFARTRNPLYLAVHSACLAIVFATNGIMVLVAWLAFAVVLHFYVIKREEAFLRDQFGQPYIDYCQKVRRYF